MRIVTWNIHGWRTVDQQPNLLAIVDTLRSLDADVIGLNEVFYPRVVAGSDQPALTFLAQQLGLHFVFGPCLRWPAQNDMPADAYGNALLSRWPIIASSAHHLTPKEEDSGNLLATKEPRGLLEARLLLPDQRTFTVYVTHLDHTDEAARLIQLRVARTWLLRDRNRPHVVMGDFNSITPWDFAERTADWETLAAHPSGKNLIAEPAGPRVIGQMEKNSYVDLYRQFAPAGAGTFWPADTPIRIDYLFASQALAPLVTACRIMGEADHVSDHRPMVAEIDL